MKYFVLLFFIFSLFACQLTDATQEVTVTPNPNTPGVNPNVGIMLVNDTGTPIYYMLMHHDSRQPLRQTVDISLNPEPKELIHAGSTAELESFDCASIEQLYNYQLILYRVTETDSADKARGTLLMVKDLTEAFLKDVQQDDSCQIRLNTFSGS